MRAQWCALRAHFLRQSDRRAFQMCFRSICGNHPHLHRFHEPGQLWQALHGPGDAADKNRILRDLIPVAQTDGAAGEVARVVLILALWPGLDAIYGRLWRFFRAEPDVLVSELLGRLTAEFARLDLDPVTWIAATLLRNVERDIRRERQKLQAKERMTEPLPEDGDEFEFACAPMASNGSASDDVDAMLACLAPDDARLVLMVVVIGASQREAAVELGIDHEAARKRYQRAIGRLKKSLASEP
jgi:DNA-directed RNA polymerase specialized sigma24 family protein